ncbi:MAG: hypothetical protein DMG93_06910 [Acidobacteria bacterium]|nr:MAG: hypothetical protein DMG93_06910 [Acidobacteriota bacterium]
MNENMVQEGSFFKPIELKQSVHFFDALQRGIELCNRSIAPTKEAENLASVVLQWIMRRFGFSRICSYTGTYSRHVTDSLPANTVRTEMILSLEVLRTA